MATGPGTVVTHRATDASCHRQRSQSDRHSRSSAGWRNYQDQYGINDRPLKTAVRGYEITTTVIALGDTLPIVDNHWIGALVVVTAGSIELGCHRGTTHTSRVFRRARARTSSK